MEKKFCGYYLTLNHYGSSLQNCGRFKKRYISFYIQKGRQIDSQRAQRGTKQIAGQYKEKYAATQKE